MWGSEGGREQYKPRDFTRFPREKTEKRIQKNWPRLPAGRQGFTQIYTDKRN